MSAWRSKISNERAGSVSPGGRRSWHLAPLNSQSSAVWNDSASLISALSFAACSLMAATSRRKTPPLCSLRYEVSQYLLNEGRPGICPASHLIQLLEQICRQGKRDFRFHATRILPR